MTATAPPLGPFVTHAIATDSRRESWWFPIDRTEPVAPKVTRVRDYVPLPTRLPAGLSEPELFAALGGWAVRE